MGITLMALVMLILMAGAVHAQTDTPTPTATPTPTETPTNSPWVYATIPPLTGTPEGQTVRFDYIASSGDVQIANLLTAILYSLWGMFIIGLLLHIRGRR